MAGITSFAADIRKVAGGGTSPEAASVLAGRWADAVEASGGDALAVVDEILPAAAWFQARLVHRRDEAGIRESADLPGAYGKAYARIANLVDTTRQSGTAVESAIDTIWKRSSVRSALPEGPVPLLGKGERWIPPTSSLRSSHQYALDIFFMSGSVRRSGAEETGPKIRSMTRGIVVSASGDWHGGDRTANYRSGGLSPKAGNGVIVYNPDTRRYVAYFHLHSVEVRPGSIVAAGDVIGRGGNTGTNARKRGHGAHVHVEIHDAAGDAWTVYRIRDYIQSM